MSPDLQFGQLTRLPHLLCMSIRCKWRWSAFNSLVGRNTEEVKGHMMPAARMGRSLKTNPDDAESKSNETLKYKNNNWNHVWKTNTHRASAIHSKSLKINSRKNCEIIFCMRKKSFSFMENISIFFPLKLSVKYESDSTLVCLSFHVDSWCKTENTQTPNRPANHEVLRAFPPLNKAGGLRLCKKSSKTLPTFLLTV